MNAGSAIADGVTRGLRERLDLHEPLQRKPRLDDRVAPRAVPDGVHIRPLLGHDQAELAKCRRDGRARLEAVEAFERAGRGDDATLVHDRDRRQVVPLADLEVVRVVGRRHLHGAGAERRVDVLVGHHRNAPPGERQLDLGADQMRVALVVRMNRDGGVAEHGLDPGGGDGDRPVRDRHELAVVVEVLDLDVGKRGQAARTPVDDALGAVDQAVVVEPFEDRADGGGEPGVHGEALAAPVDRVAEPTHLTEDLAAVLGLPLPHALDEGLAAEVVARRALLGQLALDHVLGRDAGVVHAGQPQRLVTLHAAAANQGVHERVLERVAHVQLAGDVRRWDHDAKGRLVARRVGGEVATLDPLLVQA